jgi:hypothetical protein
MKKEKFAGGYPNGVESLMVGRIDSGEGYSDVRTELEKLTDGQRKSILLLVACDRVYGFFEQRGGVANGPRLKELVRRLAAELKLERNGTKGEDVSAIEARGYYDQLVALGVLELAESIGKKDVFCTVWGVVNEMVGKTD